MNSGDMTTECERYHKMDDKIQTIEQLLLDLQKLGQGIPVVEKNTRCLLSFVYALKFGVSDVARVLRNQGGTDG